MKHDPQAMYRALTAADAAPIGTIVISHVGDTTVVATKGAATIIRPKVKL